MGMAASQVRLLQLTSRNNDIGRQLEHLSMEKMSLTREMQKVSNNYKNSLSSKVLKLSNNAGVTYVDLSYSNMMKPNTYNNNQPYLLTNSSGRVVLDDKYAEFAKMISPNGNPGGNWETNKDEILSKLTGISKDKISSYNTSSDSADSAKEKYIKAQENRDKKFNEAQKYQNSTNFAKYMGKIGNIDFANPNIVNIGSRQNAIDLLKTISEKVTQNMQNYLSDDDLEKLKEACEMASNTYINTALSSDDAFNAVNNNTTCAIQKDGSNATLNVKTFINIILENYTGTQKSTDNGTVTYGTIEKNSAAYLAYLTAEADLVNARENYNNSMMTKNQTYNGAEQTQINFYEQLFTAIVENGWIEDDGVEDNDYLNQMLQNNNYFITQMEVNDCYSPNCENSSCKYQYNYNQNLASNMDNVYTLNDENVRQEALVDYEYQKSIISSKESRIDQRMKNLETEQSAIQKMIQGIEQVKKDNIETYFSIFS